MIYLLVNEWWDNIPYSDYQGYYIKGYFTKKYKAQRAAAAKNKAEKARVERLERKGEPIDILNRYIVKEAKELGV